MADIILVRHGESTINVIGEAYHRGCDLFTPEILATPDSAFALTTAGIRHSQELGDWLREVWGLRRFIATTSSYRRAEQTYIEMGFEQPARIDPALNEHDWGDFMRCHPENILRKRHNFDARYPNETAVCAPHGESTADVYQKVASFWRGHGEHGQTAQLIISHERTLIILQMVIEGIRLTDANWAKMFQLRCGLTNAGMVIYQQEAGALQRLQIERPYPKLLRTSQVYNKSFIASLNVG